MMRVRLHFTLFSLLSAAMLLLFLLGYTAAHSPLPPAAAAALLPGETSAASHQRFIIDFAPDPAAILSSAEQTPAQTAAERHTLISRYQEIAATSQVETINSLDALLAAGQVSSYRPLWIINAIAVQGDPTAVAALAADPAVVAVRPDRIVDSFLPPADDPILTSLTATRDSSGQKEPWGIARIRAPYVWHGLGLDGDGVTIGIMDSGVDWQHPDLLPNYRGNLGGGMYAHEGNWFDAVFPDRSEPTDSVGHGTHVAGTAVGQNGIGVAPGARWIAVNIAFPDGSIYESDAHAGFQWLMAPGGDASLAPDLVNASWGGYPANTLFAPDVAALQQAGIVPIFAAGNSGPDPGTISSPAGLNGVIAIGATDQEEQAAWFSSRGPSPLSAEQNPWIAAPGTRILSSLPGGGYGYNNGTSMATPHVTGAAALLLEAKGAVSEPELVSILAATAAGVAPPHPNNDVGHGRLDAYAAVGPQAAAGTLAGTVTSGGEPLPDAPVQVVTGAGVTLTFTTDGDGRFVAWLRPGSYDLTLDLFGYAPYSTSVTIQQGNETFLPIALTPLATATIQGSVRHADNGQPIAAARVTIAGTPLEIQSAADGSFSVMLPAGSYEIRAVKTGYRAESVTLPVQSGGSYQLQLDLPPAPSLLIIDSGGWYYASELDYFTSALDLLDYGYDIWRIQTPFGQTPTLNDLTPYDVLIWSAPLDSPGRISANNVLTDYLGAGGNLFISGQNIGNFDGTFFSLQPWWHEQLKADFLGDKTSLQPISGAEGTPFAGIQFALNESGSAANQTLPDVSRPRRDSFAEPIFYYQDGNIAGLRSGQCEPYDIIYLGFGLEGVADPVDRSGILETSLHYFSQPETRFGVNILNEPYSNLVLPGDELEFSVNVYNRSEVYTDTFTIDFAGTGWTTTVVTPTLTLGPCTAGETTVKVTIPANYPQDTEETGVITAVSQNAAAFTDSMPISLKTPGDLLFVNDYRFYNRSEAYTNALNDAGIPFDSYTPDNSTSADPLLQREQFLQAYDWIIWYTGYDWFAPITPVENDALQKYLEHGGRLLLSSQDFLHYHLNTPLPGNYLGIADYRAFFDINLVMHPYPERLGSGLPFTMSLTFPPYQNNADGLVPTVSAVPLFWGDQGMPAAVGNNGPNWRTVFWGIPFETIPEADRQAALLNSLGWLSDLGDSTFTVDARSGPRHEARTYSLRLVNSSNIPRSVTISNPLPVTLTLLEETLSGGIQYHQEDNAITWTGEIPAGAAREFSYQAVPLPLLTPDTAVQNTVEIRAAGDGFTFTRSSSSWVEAPDFSRSRLTAAPNQPFAADMVTYTLALHNTGMSSSRPLSVNVRLPDDMFLITETLHSSQGTAVLAPQRILWSGNVSPQAPVTITLVTTRTITAGEMLLPATAVIDDGFTTPILVENWLQIPTHQYLFPTFFSAGRVKVVTPVTIQTE